MRRTRRVLPGTPYGDRYSVCCARLGTPSGLPVMMHSGFQGGVFSETIEGGRAGAEVELSQRGILARTPDGKRFEISYGGCQIEVGGYSGRMVFCRTEDRSLTIFCEDRKFPEALRQASVGLLDQQLDEQLVSRRRRTWRARQIGAAILLALALLLIGGYAAIRVGAPLAVKAVPVSVDREIGQRAFQVMDLEGPEVDDPVVVAAMETIVDRLAPHAALDGLDFEVHVVDAPLVNAFCLPGGVIVVYSGLIHSAADADEVAGVLAHEMAHATLRHGVERISQSIGVAAGITLILGDAQGLIALGAELFQSAAINSYSREQETAADAEAVRMMHAAGLNPLALNRFFEKLKHEGGDVPAAISWISTHPQHDQRIEAVRRQTALLREKAQVPLDIDWNEVQARLK